MILTLKTQERWMMQHCQRRPRKSSDPTKKRKPDDYLNDVGIGGTVDNEARRDEDMPNKGVADKRSRPGDTTNTRKTTKTEGRENNDGVQVHMV